MDIEAAANPKDNEIIDIKLTKKECHTLLNRTIRRMISGEYGKQIVDQLKEKIDILDKSSNQTIQEKKTCFIVFKTFSDMISKLTPTFNIFVVTPNLIMMSADNFDHDARFGKADFEEAVEYIKNKDITYIVGGYIEDIRVFEYEYVTYDRATRRITGVRTGIF